MSSPATWVHRGTGRAFRRRTTATQAGVPSGLARLHPPFWIFAYLAIEVGCQIALLFPFFVPARVYIRSAAFAAAFFLLFILRSSHASHPAWPLAIVVMVILGGSILHPDTNSAWAGVATVLLHAAILSPIFWVPRVRVDIVTVRRLFMLVWAINAASALLGVLQIYFPGRFDPAQTDVLHGTQIDALMFNLADGTRVVRPMGLTDVPGGAAAGAYYCVLLGAGFLLDRTRPWFRAVLVVAMAGSLFTIYLCQIRSQLLMLGFSLLAFAVPLARQRRLARFGALTLLIGILAFAGFVVAVAVGGAAVSDRFASLIQDDPGTIYYSNRGHFFEQTILEYLPQYPLGAGLGRWGMVYTYFSDRFLTAPPLWVEIQWTAWLYDGGVMLMITYAAALFVALRFSLRVAALPDDSPAAELKKWGTVLFAYGAGALALTFNQCAFEGTIGIDFWLLNSTVFAASLQAVG
jgi:hypothetical protein